MTNIEKLQANLKPGEGALLEAPYNRRYLTGFSSSDGYVLAAAGAAYFLTDFRYIEAAEKKVGDMACICYQKPADTIRELLKRHGIHTLYVETGVVSVCQFEVWKRAFPGVDILAEGVLDKWMDSLRRIKSPDELQKILQAQALTEKGFDHILSFIEAGRTEREIALELEFFMRRQGADGVAFDFIVVSGANSSLPHGVPGDKVVEKGDFVTMDFGALVDGWHSDMTRTVAVGWASEEQQQVYDTVLRAQEAALRILKAGLSCRDGDAAARQIIEQAGYGECFGHATGHGVGVEIHEEPRLSPRSENEFLQAGNVVTVEPGIYLPGKFGVRIEDMAFITENGCENLTKSPKTLRIL